jgi:hypothetical protein
VTEWGHLAFRPNKTGGRSVIVEAGLVVVRRDAQRRWYRLRPAPVLEIVIGLKNLEMIVLTLGTHQSVTVITPMNKSIYSEFSFIDY